MPRGRPRKKITLNDFPKVFRRSIIKLMADRKIDNLETALEIAGIVLESKNKEINKIVKTEFNNWKKSDFMTSLNKALATRDKTAHNNGFWSAKQYYRITYPCKICRKPIEIHAKSKEVKTIREILYQEGWAHNNCLK
jgi:hypothetical protein